MSDDRHPDGGRALAGLAGLARGAPLWGVFDCAQDERLAFWIRAGDAPWACLYAGQIPDELVEVAPHLVRLRSPHPGTLRLFEHGWTRSWGMFFTSNAPMADLRRHLRRYLRVATEDGRRLLFRFYDPRVLRLYLPTCTPGELEAFFGPMEKILLETPGGFEICRRAGGKLLLEEAQLPQPSPAPRA